MFIKKNNHDISMTNQDNIMQTEAILKTILPESKELLSDILPVLESNNPALLGILVFKLAEERRKTNQILLDIHKKYDKILWELKQQKSDTSSNQPLTSSPVSGILPEQDQLILHLANSRGFITATEVKKELGYKGTNAASQRLNKLVRENYLKKNQSGRKVVFTPLIK